MMKMLLVCSALMKIEESELPQGDDDEANVNAQIPETSSGSEERIAASYF